MSTFAVFGMTRDFALAEARKKTPTTRIELVKGDANGKIYDTLYPLQVGYKKHGKSGIEVSDWWPHLSTCIAESIDFIGDG